MKNYRLNRFVTAAISMFLLALFTFFYQSDTASTQTTNSLLVAAGLTATKTAVLDTSAPTGDANGNGLVNPGDRLKYSITINNPGAADALNVALADTIDANTTLVGGSVIASPVAVNDTYQSIGNVGITVPDGAGDLLSNDLDANNPGVSSALAFTQINGSAFVSDSAVATTNGSVKVNTNGSFTYTPNPGFEGTDTFTYTLSNGTGLTDTSTVSITVSGMIWFVNSAAATNGNGTLGSPFNCLTGAGCFSASANDPNDNIFLYSGSYTGGLTLKSGQTLIGQGANSSLAGAGSITGITIPTYSNALPSMGGTNPTIVTTVASTNAITVTAGNSNTIRGITIGNTTGAGIFSSGFGTLTVGAASGASDVLINDNGQALNLTGGALAGVGFASITSTGGANNISLTTITGTAALGSGALSGASGTAFNVSGGTGAITYSGTISKTNSGLAISVANKTGGTITFSGGISTSGSTGQGISLTTNTGATINFQGGMSLSTGASAAFTATGGGIINVCDKNPCGSSTTSVLNTLTTTTGTALNITSTTIGANNLTFQSISANGGTNGIFLNTTGSTGGLIVTGTVGSTTRDNSGGTIQSITGADGATTGHGVYLNSTSNVSLNHMNIHNCQGDGIHGNSVAGFTLKYTNMTTNGTSTAQLGNFHGEGDVNMVTLSGSATIDNNDFQLAYYNTFGVFNDVTPVTLNRIVMTSNTFGANDTTGGNAGVVFRAQGGTMNVTFGNSASDKNTITGAGSNTFIMDLHGTMSADLIMHNNAISNNHPNIVTGGGGVSLQSGGAGDHVTLTFNVDSNTFSGSHGAGFNIGTGVGHNGQNFSGTFNNNTIGIQGTANSGSTTGNDLFVQLEGSTSYINITNNKLYQYNPNSSGAMQLETGDDGMHINATIFVVTGNTISNPGTTVNSVNGIQLNSGPSTNDAGKTCLTLHSNSLTGSGAHGGTDIRLRQRMFTDISLLGNGSNYGGTVSDTATVNNFAIAQNGGTPTASSLVTNSPPHGFNGTCTLSLSSPANEQGTIKANDNSSNDLSFLNTTYKAPSEMLASIETFIKHSADAETIPNEKIANAEVTIESGANYPALLATFIHNTQGELSDFANKIASAFNPTAYAQKAERSKQSLAPQSTGNVNKSLGTLPVGKQIVVQFKATVNSTPANFFSVSNQGTISATGLSNVLTDDPNVAGTTDPTVTTVVQPLSISKAFGASFISVNGTTSLTFTLTNSNPLQSETGIAFTDNLPTGLVVAATPGIVNNCTNGTVTAVANSTSISYSGGGPRAANTNCTIVVNVTGTTEGAKNNTTSAITSNEGGAGLTSNTATVTVINPPTLTESFTPNQIQLGATSSLQFTLTNPNATLALNTLAFTDSLPAGVTAANTAAATTVCTDASYSITNNVISFTKPSLAAGTNCVFSVTTTGATAGLKNNPTSTVTTVNSNAGTAATATLTVVAPPTIAKAFNPTTITSGSNSTVTLTLSNSNTTGALTNASFTDTLANMTASGGAVGGTCVGTSPASLSAGATALSFSGITIPTNASCTVTFSVTSTKVGIQPNTTSGVTTTQTAIAGTQSNTANLTVNPGPATHLAVTAPATANAGTAFNFTVKALDASNNTATGYTGTIHLTSTDGAAATLPANYTFVAGDSGMHTFSATLSTAGNQTITATDTVTASITGTSSNIIVSSPTYTISGKVTNGGDGLFGVSVALTGGSTSSTTTTDAAGNYSFANLSGGNYTITPSLNGYTFVQPSISLTNVSTDQVNQNFATSDISYEGDVATRPTGDKAVDVFDLITVGNIIANQPGTTPLANGAEFQRADCAPRASKGDGSVDVQDLIQMGLYAAAQDPLTPAGGPIVAATPVAPLANQATIDTDQSNADQRSSFINQTNAPEAGTATVSAGAVSSSGGNTAIIPVQLNSSNIGGVQFSVTYDATKLSIPSLAAITDQAPGASFTFNNSTPGQLGVVAVRSTAGTAFPSPSLLLFNINFTVAPAATAGASTIDFGNTPVPIKASDPAANAATSVTTTAGAVTITGPTAATVTVSGRVLTINRRGISGVQLSLTDSEGNKRTAATTSFGYYHFDDVQTGETYILSANAKHYTFSQPIQVLSVNEETKQIDFIANEEKKIRSF